MQATSQQSHRAPDGAPLHYERHRPEQTALYRLVQQHTASFIAHSEDSTGSELPRFIKEEFDAYLECGILAHGFLRLRSGECGNDRLLAFSCKRRGFCPSCGAWRMSQTAAHLMDHVIPHVPVRQWVLSLPIPLRVLLAAQPELVKPALQVVQRVVTRHLLDHAGLKADEGHGGAVTLIQRFGSAADLNILLHCLVLVGVYRCCSADGAPTFVDVGTPTDAELQALLQTVIVRLTKLLTRRGVLVEDIGQTYLADPHAGGEQARKLRPLQAAAITYRIASGPRAGQKVLTLRGAMPRETTARQALCADIDGFSLHAAIRVEAHDRKRLEQLCRCITRPGLSDERVQINAAGQVELKLKTPWRDGTTHLVMSPLEFMQRQAALVPRPRLHLIQFLGVLAPNAKLRPLVVPQGPEVPEQTTEVAAASECETETVQARPHRISWARLLKRVFDIDMQHCPNCGAGELKIIAPILDRPVIEKILTHLGLDPQPPPRGGRARLGTTEAACAESVAPDTEHINTGSSAWRQPGWRCAARGLDAGGLRVNPDIETERAPGETSVAAESGQGNDADAIARPSGPASTAHEGVTWAAGRPKRPFDPMRRRRGRKVWRPDHRHAGRRGTHGADGFMLEYTVGFALKRAGYNGRQSLREFGACVRGMESERRWSVMAEARQLDHAERSKVVATAPNEDSRARWGVSCASGARSWAAALACTCICYTNPLPPPRK